MGKKYLLIVFLGIILVSLTGCSLSGVAGINPSQTESIVPGAHGTEMPPEIIGSPTATSSPTSTITYTPASTEIVFVVGKELTIDYLRELEIIGSEITFEQQLGRRSNYQEYLVSYISEGYKIYGLLTIPYGDPPEGGYKAIVFNHGYIPPANYRTTERYLAYVDILARNGFVVFKIDFRGHGNSEGNPTGSYFSPGYTIDAITALKSLQGMEIIDPQGIGMWGHSMAGYLVLRAMLIEPEIQAGVIWAGAVYSYEDFNLYGIEDTSYRPLATQDAPEESVHQRSSRTLFDFYGSPENGDAYWQAVSLTKNIEYLSSPIQLHHAENDPVVNIGYSMNLASVLLGNDKAYEFYIYEGGGHNLISPWFDQAINRTVEFFQENL